MNRIARWVAVAAIGALLTFEALATTKVTETPKGWLVTPLLTPNDKALKTHDECVAAATARGVGDYTCVYSAALTVAGTCDDVPMPVLPTKINADGFLEQPGIVVAALPDGSWGPTMQEGFVRGPGFPNCWVPGLVPYDPHWQAPDTRVGANDLSPSPFAYTVDPEWPIGGKCPSADPKLCYAPPHPPIPPAS